MHYLLWNAEKGDDEDEESSFFFFQQTHDFFVVFFTLQFSVFFSFSSLLIDTFYPLLSFFRVALFLSTFFSLLHKMQLTLTHVATRSLLFLLLMCQDEILSSRQHCNQRLAQCGQHDEKESEILCYLINVQIERKTAIGISIGWLGRQRTLREKSTNCKLTILKRCLSIYLSVSVHFLVASEGGNELMRFTRGKSVNELHSWSFQSHGWTVVRRRLTKMPSNDSI